MPIATSGDRLILSSEKNTEELAKKLQKKLNPGDIIFFYGEMGVGKTTFIRFLINEFQKKNKINLTEVTSPTFNILNEYDINEIKINHYDLFRLKSSQETKNLGLFENRLNSINLVEWPQIIDEKPENLIELNFEYDDDHQKRKVQIKGINL
tara:strand:- start:114 stop:569 length:456 start_codon:yes stop_codon:yes gene_type:complete